MAVWCRARRAARPESCVGDAAAADGVVASASASVDPSSGA